MSNLKDEIKILPVSLLKEYKYQKSIDYWLKVVNWTNGWHYDLDMIWILLNIEKMNLEPGSTIVDAGAGLGVFQYILAAKGYNIISLDFKPRTPAKFTKGIFDITCENRDLGDFKSDYMEFIKYPEPGTASDNKGNIILRKYNNFISHPLVSLKYRLNQLSHPIVYFKMHQHNIRERFNIAYILEKNKCHKSYGKIKFLRGTFNDIPMDSNCADLLVSVSAFEHNDRSQMPGSVKEFLRIIKPGKAMLLTTSAAEDGDWFHKPSQGWCLSLKSLQDMFAVSANIEFQFASRKQELISSIALKRRISYFYYLSGDNGLPYGQLINAQYLPIGIRKIKTK